METVSGLGCQEMFTVEQRTWILVRAGERQTEAGGGGGGGAHQDTDD